MSGQESGSARGASATSAEVARRLGSFVAEPGARYQVIVSSNVNLESLKAAQPRLSVYEWPHNYKLAETLQRRHKCSSGALMLLGTREHALEASDELVRVLRPLTFQFCKMRQQFLQIWRNARELAGLKSR